MGGALAITEVMPEQYKHMIVAPSLKVDTNTGAIAEGVLTFVITLAVLFIILKGPKSEIFKTWLLAIATVAIVMSGTAYTGPSMNPANVSCISFSIYCSAFSLYLTYVGCCDIVSFVTLNCYLSLFLFQASVVVRLPDYRYVWLSCYYTGLDSLEYD